MSYYVTTKKDLLTPEQRKQFDLITDWVEQARVDVLWRQVDHNVTDTLESDMHELGNFEDDLERFIFGWLMGEKMNAILEKYNNK